MKFIDIFNVKHGDFGVYHNVERSYICILDCGTSQRDSRLHTSCSTPKGIIDSMSHRISSIVNNRDILITHYHEDHFNGIGSFKRYRLPFFRNMYVPYIDFQAGYAKQFLYSVCLLHATSEILRVPFTLLQTYSSLFLDNYAQKHFRCYRGTFLPEIKDNNGAGVEILWPPKYIYNESKKLKDFIEKLEDALRRHDLTNAIEKARKYFSELQGKLNSQEFSGLDSRSQERVKQKEVDINEFFSIDERKGKLDREKELKNAFKELKDAVKNFLDALSIVFRINNKLIWMGDTTDEVLAILKQDLFGDFEYFKLPHHGTRDISALNIKSRKFVVSLSDGKHYQGRTYKPINKNNLEKARKDNTIIFCTDGHRNCHNNFFQFNYPNYLPFNNYPHFKNVYCSRNTIIRMDL